MKKIIAAIVLMFCASHALAQWTPEQKTLGAVALGALVVDYRQTLNIVRHPKVFYERNPLLPTYPSRRTVNAYFVAAPVVTYLVLDSMSSENRTTALKVVTLLQVLVVAHNHSIGMRVSF